MINIKNIKDSAQEVTTIECTKCHEKISIKAKFITSTFFAGVIGVGIADAPEWFTTKNDVIQMYESMNACMSKAKNYPKQREICACALSRTFLGFKYYNTKKTFTENEVNCTE